MLYQVDTKTDVLGTVEIPNGDSTLLVNVDIPNLKAAYQWLYDRHQIWYKKEVQKLPRPWTEDPILDKWKFINIHRNLDAGTRYIFNYLDTKPDELSAFANILRYRLFNNRHSHAATGGFTTYADFNYDMWYKKLRDRWSEGERVLCQSHNTCTYSGFPGRDKVERVCLVAKNAISRADEKLQEIQFGLKLGFGMEEVFSVVKSIKGFGPFLAYEVTLDLTYVYPQLDTMQWANVGPGAKRGLAYIFEGYKQKHELDLLRVLSKNIDSFMTKDQIEFLKIAADTKDELDMRLFESLMCEFQKYKKLQTGTGRSFSGHYK